MRRAIGRVMNPHLVRSRRDAAVHPEGDHFVSHASLLVALDSVPADLEEAIAFQMTPFDENEGWFADGSRWDWYTIGGRSDAYLAQGNVIQRKDIDLASLGTRRREELAKCWRKAQGEKLEHREWLYGVKPDEMLDDFLGRHAAFPAHYAFLRNRVWHEHERMGWFGGTAATECEQQGKDVHICTHEKDGARIISWGGSDSWDKMFYPRFVEPLSPETLLVTVDYHV